MSICQMKSQTYSNIRKYNIRDTLHIKTYNIPVIINHLLRDWSKQMGFNLDLN